MESPVTVHVVLAVAQVAPPGAAVIVYVVMAAPPLEADAVHDTTDWVLANEVPATPVGVDGAVAGVAGAEASDGLPEPTALLAVTVNVYGVPLVSPRTVQLVVTPSGVVQVCPPEEVTVYEVMGEPPVVVGATQETGVWVFL